MLNLVQMASLMLAEADWIADVQAMLMIEFFTIQSGKTKTINMNMYIAQRRAPIRTGGVWIGYPWLVHEERACHGRIGRIICFKWRMLVRGSVCVLLGDARARFCVSAVYWL